MTAITVHLPSLRFFSSAGSSPPGNGSGFSVAAHRLRFLETNTEKMENKIVPTKNKSIKYINIEDEIRTLLFKRDAKGLYDLGVLLEEQNDIENAKKCYKEASNLSFMSAYNKLRYLQSKGL